jgi:hypothetical protein
MIKKLAILVVAVTMGTTVYASGCSEMAAFNTKIDNALKTASFSQKTKSDINILTKECGRMHDMGMSVNTIDARNKALSLIAVN